MKVHCYPTIGKQKSVDVCAAFAAGCGGEVILDGVLRDGPAMFFGVNQTNEHIWRQCRSDLGRGFYFGDNSYFDSARGSYFRVSKNRLQHSGFGRSDGVRFRALGIEIKPWSENGEQIIVCPQSEHFMRTVVGFREDWTKETVGALRSRTERPIRIRLWNRDKAKAAATLSADLENAFALVTWSSAAAVTAVLAGVPVCVGGDCAAAPMSGVTYRLDKLPRKPREEWAGILADNQWTLDEMRSGMAWGALQ